MRAVKHVRRTISLSVVVACAAGFIALGTAFKAPCASGDWSDGRQYSKLCYSDIVPLLFTEQLTGGRVPFIDRCGPHPETNCDEYPVLTMGFMRVAAWISGPRPAAFSFVNSLLLLVCAAAAAACLAQLSGRRALLFALAPTLVFYGTMNWDLFAVALSVGGTLAFFRRREGWAGALFGLGAAAKAYPALLVLPFVVQRIRDREPDRAVALLWAAAGTWLAVNAPFAIVSPGSWWEFFRYNATRVPDFDSFWYTACSRWRLCPSTKAVNGWSFAIFVLMFAGLWIVKARLHPDFPRWTLGFPVLVLFLLSSKVYSPQYGLWLLPWFALALPDLRVWLAFEAVDVAVFVTRFHWFGTIPAFGVASGPAWTRFQVAIWMRGAVLVDSLLVWVLRRPEPLAIEALGLAPQPGVDARNDPSGVTA